MPSRIQYTPVGTALRRLLEFALPSFRVEERPVVDAVGRIMAASIRSPRPLPLAPMSHVDGYAVRTQDLQQSRRTPVQLAVIGRAGPSARPLQRLAPRTALRVLTGGFLPPGADAVIPQEEVEGGDGWVRVHSRVRPGSFVVPAGSELRTGTLILRQGHPIRPQDVGILRTLGIHRVAIALPPQLGVLSVGNELTDDPAGVGSGKILASHNDVVQHLVRAAGAEPMNLGVAPDDSDVIAERLRTALTQLDGICTVGGSSVSEIDLVEDAIRSLPGGSVPVHGLRLQPGRVAGFGVASGKPVFILPGLILSTVNAFLVLAFPWLRRALGLPPHPYATTALARLTHALHIHSFPQFAHITWVKLHGDGPEWEAAPEYGDSSSIMVLVRSDGYVYTQPPRHDRPAGTRVTVRLVPGLGARTFLGADS